MPYWNDSEEKERGDEERGIHFCALCSTHDG
jgi:hypothetical protein